MEINPQRNVEDEIKKEMFLVPQKSSPPSQIFQTQNGGMAIFEAGVQEIALPTDPTLTFGGAHTIEFSLISII